MTIAEIYAHYPITPNLARHMLRVGAVTQMIIDHWTGPKLLTEAMLRIALLHDTGNILKFDFDGHPHLLEEEAANVEHWKNLQHEWAARFANEDEMTYAIAAECGLAADEIAMMKEMGYGLMDRIATEKRFERKIVKYADMRAAPFGILPLAERLEEGHKRYLNHPTITIDLSKTQALEQAALQVERDIMRHCTITPIDITEEAIRPVMETLKSYDI